MTNPNADDIARAEHQKEVLRELVREALDNARDNGYTFVGWSPQAVAFDLTGKDADLEKYEWDTLVPFIREYFGS